MMTTFAEILPSPKPETSQDEASEAWIKRVLYDALKTMPIEEQEVLYEQFALHDYEPVKPAWQSLPFHGTRKQLKGYALARLRRNVGLKTYLATTHYDGIFPEKQYTPNVLLRQQRERRGWSVVSAPVKFRADLGVFGSMAEQV